METSTALWGVVLAPLLAIADLIVFVIGLITGGA